MSSFNTNLFPRPYIDECFSYYSIQSKTEELQPVTYWGDNFVELKDSLKKVGLYTGAMRKRIKNVTDKVNELILPEELISYVFFQNNNKMNKPAIFICLENNDSNEGRVICSSVNMIIEAGHHVFGNRCDFYLGSWEARTSHKGKPYIWVNMWDRISENPIVFRGKPKNRSDIKHEPETAHAESETFIEPEPIQSYADLMVGCIALPTGFNKQCKKPKQINYFGLTDEEKSARDYRSTLITNKYQSDQ